MSERVNCVQCGRNDQDVPLIALQVKGDQAWICPQHLPLLIHKPHLLEGKLPGTENLQAADHDH